MFRFRNAIFDLTGAVITEAGNHPKVTYKEERDTDRWVSRLF